VRPPSSACVQLPFLRAFISPRPPQEQFNITHHNPLFHYFVPSPSGSGISPEWDFTSTGNFAGDASAFVIGAKVGDIPAPSSPATNVDWLALNNVEGALASKIFRIDTVGGQPPASVSALSADRMAIVADVFVAVVRAGLCPD
jgi:hypothetical protein